MTAVPPFRVNAQIAVVKITASIKPDLPPLAAKLQEKVGVVGRVYLVRQYRNAHVFGCKREHLENLFVDIWVDDRDRLLG